METLNEIAPHIFESSPAMNMAFRLGIDMGYLDGLKGIAADLREQIGDVMTEERVGALDILIQVRAAYLAEMLEDALKALPRGISTGPEEEGRGDASTLQYSTAEPW